MHGLYLKHQVKYIDNDDTRIITDASVRLVVRGGLAQRATGQFPGGPQMLHRWGPFPLGMQRLLCSSNGRRVCMLFQFLKGRQMYMDCGVCIFIYSCFADRFLLKLINLNLIRIRWAEQEYVNIPTPINILATAPNGGPLKLISW